ncbi:FAD-dependent oxidoreductase [Ferribacterium limneticum]|uniref:FAD-dependent oxidoreductase n=1 Tax=Ferribacterium limneticum TaxID=76259 RepID=UPI001CFA6CB9|nr:FAD-dependent oxidoreductase [Ferribacterium limneticum]UCV17832.1 FAD-dependent oxidoreductase [Ferribacterium limneticum]
MSKNQKSMGAEPSRRKFLRSTVAGSAAGLAGISSFAVSDAHAAGKWDQEADILVVGTGAAASSAAITAAQSGSSVIMVEKAPVYGGTSAKADGGMWVPNNRFMRAQGKADSRNDALRYMARCARPHLYRADDPQFGMPESEFKLLEAFYDNSSKAFEFLEGIGALKTTAVLSLPDYYDSAPENKAPQGRMIMSERPDGQFGPGLELIRQLKAWVDSKKIPVLLKHRVRNLVRNDKGEVVGLEATNANGDVVLLRARKAVIFATGGFSHNQELIRNFQPGPVYGACAVPSAEGDFVAIAQTAGAKLGNMVNAWRMQLVLDHSLEMRSVPKGIWQPPGDSMIMVNKYGERVVNEKHNYHDRSRVHFNWDANREEYPNQFLFMVYDRRVEELFGGNFPLPAPGAGAPYVISGNTLEELGQAIQARLDQNVKKVGEVRLKGFAQNLAKTITTFNRYAQTGNDEQFQRGEFRWDKEWQVYTSIPRSGTSWKTDEMPSKTMHPFQAEGPYFAIILAPGVLDTNGGPVINPVAQVMDASNRPIPGLYGAGNCISSPAAQSYWGAGPTLSLAITFGHLAGVNAAKESAKDASHIQAAGNRRK